MRQESQAQVARNQKATLSEGSGNVARALDQDSAELHRTSLLLGQVANHRELVHDPSVGLDQSDDPRDEQTNAERSP